MRRIDLSSYTVEVAGTNPEGGPRTDNYNVRRSICLVLMSPQQQHGPEDVLDADMLCHKVRETEGETLLLEESEYKRLGSALDKIRGYSINDVEFVKRIRNAGEVPVMVKPEVV